MACPKCGNDTIVVTEERPNAIGIFNCIWIGLMIAIFGVYALSINIILGFIFIGGGLGMVFASGKSNKIIRCTTCGYEKVMSK